MDNAIEDLHHALQSGKIVFERGKFIGRFDARTTREIKKLGAKWDRNSSSFKIKLADLPADIVLTIRASAARLEATLKKIDEQLQKNLPEKIAEQFNLSEHFEKTLWKVDGDVKKSLKGISVAPSLTEAQARRIADEYTLNLDKYIKDFTVKETKELRERIRKRSLEGLRYETVVKEIRKSYGVSQRKAKFLARQETSLMMTKFKEVRYTDAGVKEYKWTCVAGSPKHPVRPLHKRLDGKVFQWSNPPITAENGARNNPGQDFNCRCVARPIVRF